MMDWVVIMYLLSVWYSIVPAAVPGVNLLSQEVMQNLLSPGLYSQNHIKQFCFSTLSVSKGIFFIQSLNGKAYTVKIHAVIHQTFEDFVDKFVFHILVYCTFCFTKSSKVFLDIPQNLQAPFRSFTAWAVCFLTVDGLVFMRCIQNNNWLVIWGTESSANLCLFIRHSSF